MPGLTSGEMPPASTELVGGPLELPQLPTVLAGAEPMPETVEAWERLRTSPHLEALPLTPADVTELFRWATLVDARERAMLVYNAEPMVAGSTGQPVVNPAWRVVMDCDRQIQGLSDRYGANLLSRARLGIEWSDAIDKAGRLDSAALIEKLVAENSSTIDL